MKYPLRIRFWYLVHNHAERFWHWVYRTKIAPWHTADRVNRPQVPPDYHLVQTIPATPEQQAAGMTATHVYATKPTPTVETAQKDSRYTVTYHRGT